MGLLDVNFDIISEYLTPPEIRLPKQSAWLRCFMKPLNDLIIDFGEVFYIDVVARAKRSGQKIILEDTLNKVFNSTGAQSITIDNTGDDLEFDFFYNSGESYPPTFINTEGFGDPTFIYNSFEYIGLNDFIVFVPSSVLANYNENQIIKEVEKYNPVGTNFTIKEY